MSVSSILKFALLGLGALCLLVILCDDSETAVVQGALAAPLEEESVIGEALGVSTEDPGWMLLDEFQVPYFTPDPEDVAVGRFRESFDEGLPLMQNVELAEMRAVRRGEGWVRVEAPILDSYGFEAGRVQIRLQNDDGEWKVEHVRKLRERKDRGQ